MPACFLGHRFLRVPPSNTGDFNKEDYIVQACNHETLLVYSKSVVTLSQRWALGPVFHDYLIPSQVWGCTASLSPLTSDSEHWGWLKVSPLVPYSIGISELSCKAESKTFLQDGGEALNTSTQKIHWIFNSSIFTTTVYYEEGDV